jgi:sRNA-binding carbon storage regulator CsrA
MMAGLIISRKAGQTVIIESPGFSVVMNVESTSKGKVILNFCGPGQVQIWRGELFAAVHGFDVYDRLVIESLPAKKEGTDAARCGGGQTPGACELCGAAWRCEELLDQLPWIHNDVEEGTDAAQTAVR